MARQCVRDRRFTTIEALRPETSAWHRHSNARQRGMDRRTPGIAEAFAREGCKRSKLPDRPRRVQTPRRGHRCGGLVLQRYPSGPGRGSRERRAARFRFW